MVRSFRLTESVDPSPHKSNRSRVVTSVEESCISVGPTEGTWFREGRKGSSLSGTSSGEDLIPCPSLRREVPISSQTSPRVESFRRNAASPATWRGTRNGLVDPIPFFCNSLVVRRGSRS